jgi:predicted phosphate transport protein (TIGR00153 family)
MYSGELEVQAKRKAIAVLQDEINRILNAARELSSLPELLVKKNKTDVKEKLAQISSLEDEVENLRRKITRDVSDVGGLIMNRENILNTAYTMDEIAGYITGIAFKLSNIKVKTLTTGNFQTELTELIELVVEQVYKLNEIIRSLNTDSTKSVEFAQETQKIEREIDIKYRNMSIKALDTISNTKELLLMKDIIEGIEEMADKCQEVSDSFILLALSI